MFLQLQHAKWCKSVRKLKVLAAHFKVFAAQYKYFWSPVQKSVALLQRGRGCKSYSQDSMQLSKMELFLLSLSNSWPVNQLKNRFQLTLLTILSTRTLAAEISRPLHIVPYQGNRQLDKLNLARWFGLRPSPIFINDKSDPKNASHLMSGQK